ncbi:MAG: hypothetical protein NZ572_01200 [Thermoflexus sp.]|nr:hypothetical protein [Thermoflexus sp.]
MAFTVRDFEDLTRLLDKHPEWLEALRQRLFTKELLQSPKTLRGLSTRVGKVEKSLEGLNQAVHALVESVTALAEAQRRHYEEFVALRQETDRRFAELAEAQRRTEERVGRLEEAVAALAEAQRRHYEEFVALRQEFLAYRQETDRRFAELAEAQRRHYEEFAAHRQEFLAYRQETERRFAELAEAQQRTERELLKLIRNQDLLQSTLDRFAQIIGPVVEERLIPALRAWLESQGGTPLGPVVSMTLDGIGEVDGALPVRWPDGREGWILVSVKAKVWPRSIEDLAKDILRNPRARAALRDKGVSDLVWPIVFGLTIDDRAPQTAEHEKIGLLSSQQGMIVPPVPWSLEKGNNLSDA